MKIHSSLALLALVASLRAQPAPPAEPHEAAPRPPHNISVCYETFSVPLALAAKLQREDKTDAELYTLLGTAAEKDGVRQESFDMIRSKSYQKATVESISEEIYSTEYEPPSMPGTVGVAITPPPVKDVPTPVPDTAGLKDAPPLDEIRGLRAPATPTAFETRNAGRSLEIEARTAEDPESPFVDLKIVPEQVTMVGRNAWGQGLAQTEMPIFETQRVNTGITVRTDQPVLLGTVSRPPESRLDPDSAQRVWFAFVTVMIVTP
jgi:hypothetical protein